MAIEPLEVRRAKKLASRRTAPTPKSKALQAQRIKHVREGMIGFTLEWMDTNPLGKTGEGDLKVSNKNAKQFNCAQEMWDQMNLRKWIVESVFTWIVELELIFDLPTSKTSKKERIDQYEFRCTGRLRDPLKGEDTPINNEIERKIMAELFVNSQRPELDKNKGTFRVANYKVICVGI